jgi:hypothetical protein
MEIKLYNKEVEDKIRQELIKTFGSKRGRLYSKIFSSALGSIPWVGGFLSVLADFHSDEEQVKSNILLKQWLEEHQLKMTELADTLVKVVQRLDEFPEEIDERLQSDEYLQLVKKSFRIWDNSDTLEKKELIRKLLTNAGAHKLAHDDLVRLFLDWLNSFHEAHFAVVRSIYNNEGITRYEIWQELHGQSVREDSLEADVFKLLIRDLSTGSVIRQHRETDYAGNFIKKQAKKGSGTSRTFKSAFDSTEGYELTELGRLFVHYTMTEVVSQIGAPEQKTNDI